MPLDQKRASDKNDLPLMAMDEGIVLFHPHMPAKGPEYVAHTLGTRWIGQGPKVDAFEREFRADLCEKDSTFRRVDAFEEEEEHRDLPRIAFRFNRRAWSRLRALIDAINGATPRKWE